MRLQPPNGKVRILLCGYGHLGLALLEGLLTCSDICEVVGVFRWSSKPDCNLFWEPVEGQFQKRVAQFQLPDLACPGMNSYEFTVLLGNLQPDVVLVGCWGEILRPHLLEQARPLMINCHPSLLPSHRGANPYSSVIRAGESETGVTFHRITRQIDAGSIVFQQTVPLTPYEDGNSVRDKCAATAHAAMPELLRSLHRHVHEGQPLPETEQNQEQQSYYPQLKMEDGWLNWLDTPENMYRQMRALFPWVACYSRLPNGGIVLLYDPRFVQVTGSGNDLLAPGTILSLRKGVVRVALNHPDLVMEITSYHFSLPGKADGQRYWPKWLSPWLAHLFLRPGKRLIGSQAE
jgi:methionyl-tRNA formyltransferase